MKHRKRSSKISYKHHMIQGCREFLEEIELWDEIKSIIPGRIKHVKSVQKFQMKIQYQIVTGIKCLLMSGSSVQEIFIVTGQPEEVAKKLNALNPKPKLKLKENSHGNG